MRVLVVHNRYRSTLPSGENRAVDAEIDGLRRAGVEVVSYLRSSDEIPAMSAAQQLTVPFLPLHSRRAVADLDALMAADRPDVLHLHNPWPLISLSVVPAAHRRGVPVVATVHNHRHSCMRGSYFRDGHDCRQCEGRALPWPAVQHGCYRDSRLQSIPMAAAFRLHRKDQRAVDRYVALSQPIADSILASGLVSPDQVVLRPNSVPDPGPPTPPGQGLLYVGRLSAEKGVPLLLEAWEAAGRPFGTLIVAGDGPERPLVEARAQQPGSGVVAAGRAGHRWRQRGAARSRCGCRAEHLAGRDAAGGAGGVRPRSAGHRDRRARRRRRHLRGLARAPDGGRAGRGAHPGRGRGQ